MASQAGEGPFGLPFQKLLRSRGLLVLPGIAATIVALLLQLAAFAPLERIGLLLFDSYQRAAPRSYQDAPVRIVDIDDETIRRHGQWPWPRTDLARLTAALTEAGAASIAYDIVFSESDRTSPSVLARRLEGDKQAANVVASLKALPDNDAQFASVIGQSPVTLGYFMTREKQGGAIEGKAGVAVAGSVPNGAIAQYQGALLPIAPLRASASGLGFVSLAGDADGILRKAPLVAVHQGQIMPSLGLEALRVAQQAGSVIVKSNDASGEFGGSGGEVVSLKIGDFEVPTTAAGELWLHYTTPRPERIVPAWKILDGALPPAEMQRLFGGQIIFVGSGAAGLRDLKSTPMQDAELGVMAHAQAVEQMVLGHFVVRPDWALGLERALLVVVGLLMAIVLPRLGAMRGAILGLALVTGIIAGSWYGYTGYRYLLDPTYPVLALVAVYLTSTGVTFYSEERQRAYIHQAFDRYLSPAMVRRIVNDPGQLELGGEEREMTVLFCDIRSFSRISEAMGPQDIIRFLIGFLTPMCDILLNRKATIDKFIGDAILAFWNAPLDDPDQHANAARGALEMVTRLEALNREMPGTDTPWPGNVNIGIGLNAGPCCVGNMGSAQRLSYSLIGDTVNLASRLEGLTKYYGVRIIIGAALQAQIPQFAALALDRVRVVGRDTPEMIHALVGDEALAATPDFAAFAEAHRDMLSAYWAQDWDRAEMLMDETKDTAAKHGLAQHYRLLRDRITGFRLKPPPAGWDGVFAAIEK